MPWTNVNVRSSWKLFGKNSEKGFDKREKGGIIYGVMPDTSSEHFNRRGLYDLIFSFLQRESDGITFFVYRGLIEI